jgi:hypothetical protein
MKLWKLKAWKSYYDVCKYLIWEGVLGGEEGEGNKKLSHTYKMKRIPW